MELNLQKQTIVINDTVFDGKVEHPVECDAQLPDYCPDISKILKCSVAVHIHSTTITAERLVIEGIVHIKVYYLSEQGGLRRAEYRVPITKQVEMRKAPANPIVTASPSVDYMNCRAVNQRRIDVRGAVSLAVKVTDQINTEIISHAEGAGLQLRSDIVQSVEMVRRCESSFSIQEELELGYGKPAIGTIIRSSCAVNVQSYKIVTGKVVTKGDILLQLSYLAADNPNSLEVMEYTLPISQIIDCDGVDEQSVCDISMNAASCDIQPKGDEAGEYTSFSLDVRTDVLVCAWRQKEVSIASDCYSTQYDCGCRQLALPFLRLEKILNEVISRKTVLDLPEGVEKVMDLWCDIEKLDWKYANEALSVSLRLNVCMFSQMLDDSGCLYFEQPYEIEENIPVPCAGDTIKFDPVCGITTCSFGPTGGESIEFRVDISVRGCVFCGFNQLSLSGIEIDENAPKQKEKNKLYLYYASDGESVWNIAKRYNTSVDAIWDENAVESDTLSGKCMLVIPIV